MGSWLTVAGIATALPSVGQTVAHITDDTYRAPEARHGEGHVQYHMARETMMSAGAPATVALGVAAGPDRAAGVWRGMPESARRSKVGAGWRAGGWQDRP